MNKRILISMLVLVVLVTSAQWGPHFFSKFKKNTQKKAFHPVSVLAANESQWGSNPFYGMDPAVVQKQLSQPQKPAKNTDSNTNADNQSTNTAEDSQKTSQEDANKTTTTTPSPSPSSTEGSSKSNDDIMRGY